MLRRHGLVLKMLNETVEIVQCSMSAPSLPTLALNSIDHATKYQVCFLKTKRA